MKRNEEVFYRPDLANQLRQVLNTAITFYSVNFLHMYYDFLSKVYVLTEDNAKEFNADFFVEKYADKNTENGQKSLFLKKVADCFKNPNEYKKFIKKYAYDMEKKYHIKLVSEAEAACQLFNMYGNNLFENFKNKIIEQTKNPPLTDMELFLINDFFLIVTSPMRNPNIQVQEGETKCWYDNHPYDNYKADFAQSVQWISENLERTIEIFK